MYSLVIPVYKNEGSVPDLLAALTELDRSLRGGLDVVFVIDGSPDRSFELLRASLPGCSFPSRLVLLSRNFGSFSAIRTGLSEARGPYFAVMAADLQEPPDLVREFFRVLESEPVDIVVGTRTQRHDPLLTRWASQLYWFAYRALVQADMPRGGVDVFGCNREFRDQLLGLEESNSSLVGLIFWLGFRRKLIGYERLPRRHGRSAWTVARKLRYMTDSVFAFSDLPVRLLVLIGGIGLLCSAFFSVVVLAARVSGLIPVPGYAATVLLIAFFAALNSLGLGVIGSYVWRAFENTKRRPQAVVMARVDLGGGKRE